jgi:hypothetical protein
MPVIENNDERYCRLPPQLDALLSLWRKKIASGLPQEKDFDEETTAPWRGNFALIDCEGEDDFRFRRCGAGLIRRLGREATGSMAKALAGDVAAELHASLMRCVAEGVPVTARASVAMGRRSRICYVDLVLPLAGANGRAATLLFSSCKVAE